MYIVLSLNQVVVAGSELTRGGTAVRGGGRVTSETGKKAISDMVDSYGKILKTGKGVDEKNKNTKPKNPEEEARAKAKKDLQKDIKQFLARISIGCHLTFWFSSQPPTLFWSSPQLQSPGAPAKAEGQIQQSQGAGNGSPNAGNPASRGTINSNTAIY